MERLKRPLLYLSLLCVLLFIALIFAAVFYYDGGNALQSGLGEFSLKYNSLSDLGRSRGYDGAANRLPQEFFTIALYSLSAGLLMLQLLWIFTFQRHRSRLWAGASLLLGGLAIIQWVGVTEFPADENFPRHQLFLTRSVAAFSLVNITAFFAHFFEPVYKKIPSWPWLLAGIIIGSRGLILFLAWEPWLSESRLLWHLVLQKLAWLSIAAILLYQIFVLKRHWTRSGK